MFCDSGALMRAGGSFGCLEGGREENHLFKAWKAGQLYEIFKAMHVANINDFKLKSLVHNIGLNFSYINIGKRGLF